MHIFARAALLGYLGYWTYHVVQQEQGLSMTVKIIAVIVIPAILGYLSVNRSPPKDGLCHM